MPGKFSPTSVAKARYAGRALALVKHAVLERQNGSNVFKYHSPDGGDYLVDVSEDVGICDCAEFRVNMHLASAAERGERVYRNPGAVCKHILSARVLASVPGTDSAFDIHRIIEEMPESLRAEAKAAYFAEARRL